MKDEKSDHADDDHRMMASAIYVASMIITTILWFLRIEINGNRVLAVLEVLVELSFTWFISIYWVKRIWGKNLKEPKGKVSRLLCWVAFYFSLVYAFLLVPSFIFMIVTKKVRNLGKFLGEDSPCIALVYIIINALGFLPRPSSISYKIDLLAYVCIQVIFVVSMIVTYKKNREDILPYTSMACGLGLGAFTLLKELSVIPREDCSEKNSKNYNRIRYLVAITSIIVLYEFKIKLENTPPHIARLQ
ncbi:hypothetical protein EROM_010010 [Encephalitozoon romaleae SJ-2008]|uniref:Uncharacterized protein n=1 Tax=Encephalitozoon romaleae (strain SJ-2008) TaxID=1178016 RepID=I6ZRY8_ENCRO|nr:hypothetical protein EROM_010010 [Encephalitozoon romaleae SJ-2008]AFN82346.1 hypothetical protein EROM_010010 [Encephalitozoon romaleae SJ-2008]